IWETVDTFDKYRLTNDCYLIEQYNKTIRYWNIRLLSSKINFECYGLTHEYWSCEKSNFNRERLENLKINDQEDGGCKSDKFTRDERLLREGINDPKTKETLRTRYKFYLAQTLRDMGNFEESI